MPKEPPKQYITEAELVAAGYTRCSKNDHSFPYSDFFYQKKFRDAQGIKYFVELVHYSHSEGPVTEAWSSYMNINQPHMTFQIHRPNSLATVE